MKKIISVLLAVVMACTSLLAVSATAFAEDGISIEDISFSFSENKLEYDSNYVVPYDVYRHAYDNYGTIEQRFEMNCNSLNPDHSYGMVALAAMLYRSGKNPSELNPDDLDMGYKMDNETVKDGIEIMQALWCAKPEFEYCREDTFSSKTMEKVDGIDYGFTTFIDALLGRIYDKMYCYEDLPIIVMSKVLDDGSVVNHFVLAYGYDSESNEVKVYDPDYPMTERYIKIVGDEQSWEYEDYTEVYILNYGAAISSYEWVEDTNDVLFTEMQNARIYKQDADTLEKELIAEIENGKLELYRGSYEIVPVNGKSVVNKGTAIELLDIGWSESFIVESNEPISFSVSNGFTYMRLDTEATEVKLCLSWDYSENYLDIMGKTGDKYAINVVNYETPIRVTGELDDELYHVNIDEIKSPNAYDCNIDGHIIATYHTHGENAVNIDVCRMCHEINVDYSEITHTQKPINNYSFDIIARCKDCNLEVSRTTYTLPIPTQDEINAEVMGRPQTEQGYNETGEVVPQIIYVQPDPIVQYVNVYVPVAAEAPVATAPATTISKLTPGKKQVKVTWKKKAGVTGYVIQYSTDKKFKKGVKSVTVKGDSKASTTIKKLTSKKTYYVRIQTVNGSVKSSWSKAKSTKIK